MLVTHYKIAFQKKEVLWPKTAMNCRGHRLDLRPLEGARLNKRPGTHTQGPRRLDDSEDEDFGEEVYEEFAEDDPEDPDEDAAEDFF